MAKLHLTHKAIADLSRIWNYICGFHSEDQADKFYDLLISSCQEIAKNPELGKNYSAISQNLFAVKTNRHFVFYTTRDDAVEIIRIVNEKIVLKGQGKD